MAKANGAKDLESRKLHLQVYDEIKNYIERNRLMPGGKPSSGMRTCEMSGISRNVLRGAIKSLETMSTVCSIPGVGTVTQEFNTDSFLSNLIYGISDEGQPHKEVEELRRVLEPGLVKNAYKNITPESLGSLTKEIKIMESLPIQIKQSRPSVYGARFTGVDASLHRVLFQAVDNHLLKSIVKFFQVCDRYYKIRTIRSNTELTVEKHPRICDAIKAWDHQKYYDTMQLYLSVGYFKR